MFPLVFVAAVAFWGTVLGGGLYFARRLVRAVESRRNDESELLELRRRIASLEETNERTQRDVERLETSQDFTNKLLANRPANPDRIG